MMFFVKIDAFATKKLFEIYTNKFYEVVSYFLVMSYLFIVNYFLCCRLNKALLKVFRLVLRRNESINNLVINDEFWKDNVFVG